MFRGTSLLGVTFTGATLADLFIAAERFGVNVFDLEQPGGRRQRVTRIGGAWAVRDSRTACWRPFLDFAA